MDRQDARGLRKLAAGDAAHRVYGADEVSH
jgi:hypothetical protein